MKLLSVGNPKVLKGMDQGYMTYILHLAPANVSGYAPSGLKVAPWPASIRLGVAACFVKANPLT
jgi:hypothetical protein